MTVRLAVAHSCRRWNMSTTRRAVGGRPTQQKQQSGARLTRYRPPTVSASSTRLAGSSRAAPAAAAAAATTKKTNEHGCVVPCCDAAYVEPVPKCRPLPEPCSGPEPDDRLPHDPCKRPLYAKGCDGCGLTQGCDARPECAHIPPERENNGKKIRENVCRPRMSHIRPVTSANQVSGNKNEEAKNLLVREYLGFHSERTDRNVMFRANECQEQSWYYTWPQDHKREGFLHHDKCGRLEWLEIGLSDLCDRDANDCDHIVYDAERGQWTAQPSVRRLEIGVGLVGKNAAGEPVEAIQCDGTVQLEKIHNGPDKTPCVSRVCYDEFGRVTGAEECDVPCREVGAPSAVLCPARVTLDEHGCIAQVDECELPGCPPVGPPDAVFCPARVTLDSAGCLLAVDECELPCREVGTPGAVLCPARVTLDEHGCIAQVDECELPGCPPVGPPDAVFCPARVTLDSAGCLLAVDECELPCREVGTPGAVLCPARVTLDEHGCIAQVDTCDLPGCQPVGPPDAVFCPARVTLDSTGCLLAVDECDLPCRKVGEPCANLFPARVRLDADGCIESVSEDTLCIGDLCNVCDSTADKEDVLRWDGAHWCPDTALRCLHAGKGLVAYDECGNRLHDGEICGTSGRVALKPLESAPGTYCPARVTVDEDGCIVRVDECPFPACTPVGPPGSTVCPARITFDADGCIQHIDECPIPGCTPVGPPGAVLCPARVTLDATGCIAQVDECEFPACTPVGTPGAVLCPARVTLDAEGCIAQVDECEFPACTPVGTPGAVLCPARVTLDAEGCIAQVDECEFPACTPVGTPGAVLCPARVTLDAEGCIARIDECELPDCRPVGTPCAEYCPASVRLDDKGCVVSVDECSMCIGDLSDVCDTEAERGDALRWNGCHWCPEAPFEWVRAGKGLQTNTDSDTITRRGTLSLKPLASAPGVFCPAKVTVDDDGCIVSVDECPPPPCRKVGEPGLSACPVRVTLDDEGCLAHVEECCVAVADLCDVCDDTPPQRNEVLRFRPLALRSGESGAGGSGGGGGQWCPAPAVSEIRTGKGLIGGPITDDGEISLKPLASAPGTYCPARVTVDAGGCITHVEECELPCHRVGQPCLDAQPARVVLDERGCVKHVEAIELSLASLGDVCLCDLDEDACEFLQWDSDACCFVPGTAITELRVGKGLRTASGCSTIKHCDELSLKPLASEPGVFWPAEVTVDKDGCIVRVDHRLGDECDHLQMRNGKWVAAPSVRSLRVGPALVQKGKVCDVSVDLKCLHKDTVSTSCLHAIDYDKYGRVTASRDCFTDASPCDHLQYVAGKGWVAAPSVRSVTVGAGLTPQGKHACDVDVALECLHIEPFTVPCNATAHVDKFGRVTGYEECVDCWTIDVCENFEQPCVEPCTEAAQCPQFEDFAVTARDKHTGEVSDKIVPYLFDSCNPPAGCNNGFLVTTGGGAIGPGNLDCPNNECLGTVLILADSVVVEEPTSPDVGHGCPLPACAGGKMQLDFFCPVQLQSLTVINAALNGRVVAVDNCGHETVVVVQGCGQNSRVEVDLGGLCAIVRVCIEFCHEFALADIKYRKRVECECCCYTVTHDARRAGEGGEDLHVLHLKGDGIVTNISAAALRPAGLSTADVLLHTGAPCVAPSRGSGFTGPFDVSNWVQTPGCGSVEMTASKAVLVSCNDKDYIDPAESTACITVELPKCTHISFDWHWKSNDRDAQAVFDMPGYKLNGTFVPLVDPRVRIEASGHTAITLRADEEFEFCFAQQTQDSLFGSASLTITNFAYTFDAGVRRNETYCHAEEHAILPCPVRLDSDSGASACAVYGPEPKRRTFRAGDVYEVRTRSAPGTRAFTVHVDVCYYKTPTRPKARCDLVRLPRKDHDGRILS